VWGLPFLERVTEGESALPVASDCRYGVRGVPCTRDVVPERECRPDPPKVPLCCTLLVSIFRNVTKDASEWGRCFCCDGGISSYALELVPFIRGELQLPAWCQVC
jgi:hypothetical protein